MAVIVFYEKPGCVNNTRQKHLLTQSGHDVVALDIRVQAWNPTSLRPFFGDRPVTEWFNQAAPRVKSGAVRPDRIAADEALAEMCLDPLLIRRPLIECEGRRLAGFDEGILQQWIGLAQPETPMPQSCSQPSGFCPEPGK